VGASEVGGVFQVGINDFGRFAKTLGGAAMDNFYSDENEMQREYQRYKDNFLYNQEVRPAMLETYDEEGRDFVSFGANFVDPTLLVPGAGLVAKGGSLGAKAVATGAKAGAFAARSPRLVQLSKAMARTSRGAEKVAKGLDKASEVASIPAKLAASGTRKAIKGSALVGSKIAGGVGRTGEAVSKVAALPRNLATKLIPKLDPKTAGAVAATAQIGAATQGMVPGLGILTSAEILGFLANKTGRGVERTLSALSSKGGQKRFLQRLATTADSPRLRKLALMAHAGGATKLTDLAFNSLVNGASVGVLNGALAYASGEGAEGVGAAVGSGTLMGGSLPFGQPGMKGGKSQAARDQSSINFLNAKLADDQIKEFRKLSPEARLAFATVEEAGIRAPKLAFLDKQTYLGFLRQEDPNLRQEPNAHYDMGDNTIYVNQDGNAGRSSKEAMDILTHELGHHFITQGIKDDPLFARKILEQYEAKPGEESFEFAFTTDSAGSPIDSIQLNADAKKISDGYDSIQSGDQSISVGMDANKLAQEIGAEQFAMMMVDNPNIFNTIEPSLRQKLLDGSRKVLTMFGAVDPYTGNPLDISISPILKRNKQVRNLYKNYIKQREKSIVDKVDLAEKGVAIKVRKGESADQAVERMFGAQGISLKDAGAFRINNRKIREKLSQILNRLDEQPEGPMSSERNPRSGKPQSIVGKELSPELRNVFTRNDPRGTINVLINDITESIKNRIQLNFLYRSGKPSKYSDNELRARVVSPVRFKVTGILAKGPKSAASLKMDAIDEAYLRNNVEVLVKEGFAKDPNKLIEQAREVARQAMDDPEGRINPEGNFENELITAVFGMEQSAPQIRNARLRQLLEDKKLQHAYRSYDVDALAGIAPTGKSGIAFDYFNIKNNYSPFDDKLFIPAYHGTPHTFSAEPGAPLGRFRTSAIGTGEGAQAYGHGLYFAGKREVADHYRKVLSGKKDDIYQEYDGQPFDRTNPKHEAARRLNKEARILGYITGGRGPNRDLVRPRVIDQIKGQLQRRDLDRSVKEKLRDVSKVLENKQEAKVNEGSLYKVELAPKENEYLLWDKTLGEQPKGVQDKLKKFLREQEGEDTWQYRQEQDYRDITNNVLDDMPEAEISKRLKEAGIPGIKYLDGSSRSKGEGDFNYVIFDEADVTVTEKLFMPASEAGAGKGTSALDILKSNQKPEGLPKVPTILEIAKYFEKEFGDPIDYKKSTPEKNRLFEDLIFEEVLYAQELHPEAAGWYDENLSLALSVLGELDPTILKPDNNFIFKSVLAATSDGNKVQPQFDQTWATYNNWKNTGEISGKFVGGDRISNIKNNLLRIEAIYQLMGGEGAGRWLSQKGTISEIRKAAQDDLGYTKAEAGKIGTSELVDEVVPYAVILGPKLGSFFNNLYGDYSTFTMDRWFMRTVGRNTGTQVVPIPPAKLNAAKQRVRDAVNSLTPAERKKIGVTKQGVAGNSAIKASTKLAGYFTKKQNRTGVSAEVDNLRRAANALNKFGKPLKEAPQNGAERRWLRERLETVQSRLRDVGVNLENADLQALLWYNEKEIYEKLGYRSPTGSADYAGAAEALHARKAGKPSRSYAEGTGRVGEIGRSASESVLGEKNPQEVNFLPAGDFSSQPANRIQQQAPAIPGNRFMAPAASAGAKLSERFR